MEENYILSVLGKQCVNGEFDNIELKTTAAYVVKNGSRYITYKEYDAQNPKNQSRTTVKIDPDNIVTVIKGGTESHNLVLEKGVRHKCEYITNFGNITLGIYTDNVKTDFDNKGGKLEVKYSIDIQSELASPNELILKIEEAKHNVNIGKDGCRT